MKQILFFFKVLVIGAITAFCLCTMAPVAGGNSSQTGNNGITVSASVKTISGTTARDAHISIYEQNFRPYLTPSGFCDSTVADDSGRFAFSIVQDGYFNLFVNDVRRGSAGFIARIPVFADSVFSDTIDTLKQPGFVAGTATDTAGRTYALSYLFIDGSPFYTVTKNDGGFLLGPLPAGTYATGLYANFQVIDIKTGAIAQMASATKDTSVITVFPDSISQWKW
jgi:hypothetical protein